MNEMTDKKGKTYLEVKYYDYDAEFLSEVHYLDNKISLKRFNINFLRSHMKRPEFNLEISSPAEAIRIQPLLRYPSYVIARKQGKFWRITEKIFTEELI